MCVLQAVGKSVVQLIGGLEKTSVCMRVARWGRTPLVVARLSSNFSWRAPPFQLTHPIRSRTRRQWLAPRREFRSESAYRASTGMGMTLLKLGG